MTMTLRLFAVTCLLAVLAGAEGTVHALPAGLRLTLPADWVVDAPTPGSALIVHSPTIAGADAGIAVVAVAAELRTVGDAATVLAEGVALLREQAQAFEVVEPVIAVAIEGLTCARTRYRFATGELRWEQLSIATVVDGTAVCVTCSASADEIARWLPSFESALSSLARPIQPTLPRQ